MRGIPVRVEIGPKDIEAGKCVLVRRDTREKIECGLDEIEETVGQLLETIQKDMLERARAHRDAHTYVARTMDEMEEILTHRPGFVKAMWCGCQECEDKIKEKFAATSRCMPFEQEEVSDVCVCCQKPAKKMGIPGAKRIKLPDSSAGGSPLEGAAGQYRSLTPAMKERGNPREFVLFQV